MTLDQRRAKEREAQAREAAKQIERQQRSQQVMRAVTLARQRGTPHA